MFTNFRAKRDGNQVHIEGRCIVTGKPVRMTIPLEGFINYFQKDMLIQQALPTLSPAEREFFVSGISPAGWEIAFPEGEMGYDEGYD